MVASVYRRLGRRASAINSIACAVAAAITAAWWRAVPSGARTTYCSKRRGSGPHVAELPVQHARLAPQIGEVGRQHQHRLDDFDGPLVTLLLHQPRFQIVLQAQQHVSVRDRRVKFGQQLAVRRRQPPSAVRAIRPRRIPGRGGTDRGSAAPAIAESGSENARERQARPPGQPWARAASMNRIPSTTGKPFWRSITRIRLAFCKSS